MAVRWLERLRWGRMPVRLSSWLREPTSLTVRAQRQFHTFAVRPLFQGRAPNLLGLEFAARPHSTIREVLLVGNGVPFIFAHSAVTGAARGQLTCWLKGLGNRSLGSLLFKHPGFWRGKRVYARLDQRSLLYQRCLASLPKSAVSDQQPAVLWARRCEHRFGPQSIWVIEVFLADFLTDTLE